MNSFGKSAGGGRRTAPREAAPLVALFSTISHSGRAIVIDVSPTGARLRGAGLPPAGEALEVSIECVRAFASVIWSEGAECGISFETPLTDREVRRLRERIAATAGLPPQLKAALEQWMTSVAR
jgi:hypothetical protein